MNFKGVIFDLDGVLCFTDRYHYRAWKALADRLGIYFDEKINDRLRGVSRAASLEIILEGSERVYSQEEKERFAAEKNETYRALLKDMAPADVSASVRDTLVRLREAGVLLAVGSKPDPEVFLKAAEYLGLQPADCLIVEDAEAGIEAGVAGGFRTAGLGEASGYPKTNYRLEQFSDLLKIVL